MQHTKKMISIWTWVGLVLTVYGLIVTGCGLYYLVEPETKTAMAAIHPSLWWGAIMVVAGAVFLLLGPIGKILGIGENSAENGEG